MDSGLFGEGSIRLDWTGVGGFPGLLPQLLLKGTLAARGYGVGAVIQISTEVTAWDIVGTYSFLGTTTPRAYVLNGVQPSHVRPNPPPPDETTLEVGLKLPMSPSVIEGLEERRQGKDFSFHLGTTVLLIDGGKRTRARAEEYYETYPMRTAEDKLQIRQHEWISVLEQWGRGVGIPVLIPLAASEPSPTRTAVVQHLRTARQKIDEGDYLGSFAESRKALELLRGMSPAKLPLPKDPKERDPCQRIHAVVDALYVLASAPLHTDVPVQNFVPARADAVSVVATSASLAQEVFAWIDR